MNRARRIGIFGGTFDPPHIAHQILAAEAADQLDLEVVLWVLTPDPPHKPNQTITPLQVRIRMVDAAIKANSNFELSRVEIDRPAPHFAVDTVKLLRERYPGADLVYLIGGDSLHDLPTWHTPQAFVDSCDQLGVMDRPGERVDFTELEVIIPGMTGKVRFIDTPLIEISSSYVRNQVAFGKPYRYYIPEEVYQIIISEGLYQLINSDGL